MPIKRQSGCRLKINICGRISEERLMKLPVSSEMPMAERKYKDLRKDVVEGAVLWQTKKTGQRE